MFIFGKSCNQTGEMHINEYVLKHIMETETQQIMRKLDHIQSDIKYLKNHMTDIDLVLTEDDELALRQAESDLKAGKTKRL